MAGSECTKNEWQHFSHVGGASGGGVTVGGNAKARFCRMEVKIQPFWTGMVIGLPVVCGIFGLPAWSAEVNYASLAVGVVGGIGLALKFLPKKHRPVLVRLLD
jgi:hypothetical protein